MFQGTEYQQLDIMSPQQIINLPVSQKSKNRLYLCWRNQKAVQCKMIGPQTKCFCNHRFKQHQYMNPQGKIAKCKAPKCKCKCFDYIPTHGSYDFKCLCKHSYKQHNCITKTCNKNGCKDCNGFASAWTCSCGSKFGQHKTIIETYDERKAKGKLVNDMMRMNQQLSTTTQEGSLLKPLNIKCDREDRARQKRDSGSMGLIMNENAYYQQFQKKIEQQEQIQELNLVNPGFMGYCCGAKNKKSQQNYH